MSRVCFFLHCQAPSTLLLKYVFVGERIHFDRDAFAIQLVLQQCCVKVFRRPFYYRLKGSARP